MNYLEKALFDTGSIKIAPIEKQFWYTSGTIGPYFINTHFLFGSEKDANGLLDFIDENISNKKFLTLGLKKKVLDFYYSNKLYKAVIDYFINVLSNNEEFNESEVITGGERRDWFFSIITAYLTKKDHLYIFKDLSIFDENSQVADIGNKKVCHICDLVTQASSYKRAWIPAIKNINGNFIINASIVDRGEGGKEFFLENRIKYISMVTIDNGFLEMLKDNKVINDGQFKLITDFKSEPISYGKDYILKNPAFIIDSYNDLKNRSKVIRCIKENPYNFDFNEILGNDFEKIKKEIN
jgi:orotate phosphoribosyltransferase